MITRRFAFVLCAAAVVVAGLSVPAAAQDRTVNDGVYTDQQATRGRTAYREQCAACHAADLFGGEMAPGLKGSGFIGGWSGATLWEFADFTNATMPQDAPGRLTARQLNDVIAFILQSNDYPAGEDELAIELASPGDPIRIE
ncbi:MAG: cytochrome c [Acidobacteria bacterium]|nr:cytochrome c [Acidobacteriota bacterium]